MDEIQAWLEQTGLPVGSPVELLVSFVALAFAFWLLMHLLFDS